MHANIKYIFLKDQEIDLKLLSSYRER